MHVDLGNVLDTTPGLTEETLDRLDSRVADAHDRIATGMADDEFGYAALNLPETADPTRSAPRPISSTASKRS